MKMQSAINVTSDHPAFAGHFPAFPVMPGAMLLDEMLKAIELARGIDLQRWRIGSAKFFGAVRPLETLLMEHDASAPGLIHFTIRVENRKVASGSLHES